MSYKSGIPVFNTNRGDLGQAGMLLIILLKDVQGHKGDCLTTNGLLNTRCPNCIDFPILY